MTSNCHNSVIVNKQEEEVVIVEMMRKMLKEMKDKWWVVRGSNPGQMD
jgi:hypothetical protein